MKINRIPQAVLNACSNLEMSDAEIERLSPKELLAAYLQWEGIIGYDHVLWDIVTKLQHGGQR